MKKISSWLLFILAPLPILYFVFHYFTTLGHLNELEEKMELLHTRKEQAEQFQKRQHLALTSVSRSDPAYIDKHLEGLVFLEPEIKKIETLFSDSSLDDTVQQRLHFLKSGSNRLQFSEEKIRSKEKVREVYEKQQHPVEINDEDLKQLLCLIEGVTIWPYGPREGKPQLVIQDFNLSKKRHQPQDHIFSITMHLIKRENNEASP